MFPPSAERPQQSDEQVVPQPTLSPSVSDGSPTQSTQKIFLSRCAHRVSTQELTATSLRRTEDTGRENKHLMCRTALALARQNLHSSHCVDQNNTLVDLAGKKSDVTEAKLKTSPVVTKQLHSPARVSPHFSFFFCYFCFPSLPLILPVFFLFFSPFFHLFLSFFTFFQFFLTAARWNGTFG